MSYQVLARKYRPQTFGEVVGQEHVTVTLQNALEQKRIHHSYLFCGSRGVGKTTVARLFAKALNCERGPGREPCNQCTVCLEITEGHSLDVQEIDGASNTSVDDVREIREQVKYLPTKGHYRIYIIDEVHMLSTSAFNALLKTLEEPPPHVLFIFATTEWQKIPATILSRCQRYDFRRIPTMDIVASLKAIAAKEKVEVAEEALHLLARESEGSLRDAESLFDQAIAFAGKTVSTQHLQKMLGFLDREQVFQLLEFVTNKEPQKSLQLLYQVFQSGADLNRLALDLVEGFRLLLLLRTAAPTASDLDLSEAEWNRFKTLAATRTMVEWDQLFQLAYAGLEDVLQSSHPKMILEVLLVRMTHMDSFALVETLVEKAPVMEQRPQTVAARPAAVGQTAAPKQDWTSFLGWASKIKPQVSSIFQHGRFVAFEGSQILFTFDSKEKVYAEMLEEPERKDQIRQMLKEFFQKQMDIKLVNGTQTMPQPDPAKKADLRKQQVEHALSHESVQAAADVFGARVEEVRPLTKE